jgi:hypothetical protein
MTEQSARRAEPVRGKEAYTDMHADGPFELSGIDRVRTRDGLVAENWIAFNTAEFKARSGEDVPWA